MGIFTCIYGISKFIGWLTTKGIHKKEKFNVAFIGRGGTGKTHLIKGIFGKEARIEEFEGCIKYEGSTYSNISAWEMPKFVHGNAVKYYEENQLVIFDLIIVVSQATLGTDEEKLLFEAKKQKLPVILVRSKCDNDDLENFKIVKNTFNVNQEAALKLVRHLTTKFEESLTFSQLSNIPTFFVSAVAFQKGVGNLQQHTYFQEREFLHCLKETAAKKFYYY
uniref:G domain-containing protein n=1 Tax=Panagrolaimus superbus TaxID=310955 RepID=A0A914YUG9_9BILA